MHPLEACHLFSLLSTAPRREETAEQRLAELKMDAEEGVFLFGAFLRASGTVATLPYQREPSSDENRPTAFFFFF